MSKLIMEFNIRIKGEEVSAMNSPQGRVVIIPFDGNVESDLFTGEVLPGAADVQQVNAAGIRHMCAQYMFRGKDSQGNDCHLFVENNGYFEPDSNPSPFKACPTFMTDSPVLAPYLSQARFRAEGHPAPQGVCIKIFDVLEEA